MTQSNIHKDTEIGNNSGYTQSLWMEVEVPTFAPLMEDITADVCIVGAGIVGLTCAYTLAKQGKSVVVLDQGAIGGGQTARTTAHLSWILESRYFEFEKMFGEEAARQIAESHSAAIDYIEKIVREEKIDCDFERLDGYLFTAPEDSHDTLDKEFNAIKKTGMEVSKSEKAPFNSSVDTGPCLQFPRQGQFHILKYLQGLIKAILKLGGKLFSYSHVNHIEDGSPCHVKTAAGAKVTAQSIIVATCSPINDRLIMHTKQAAYRTYVIAATIPRGSVPKGLYWDTADPYHYVRLQNNLKDPNLEWLIIGGEDHKTGQDLEINEKYDHLEKWARERFSMIQKIDHRWSGQVFESMDGIAFIGRNPTNNHLYISTGDTGNGMTHGTIAGILVSDLIFGKNNPWKDLYDPSRKTISAASEFIEENLNALAQLKDWFTPGETTKVEALAPEEGVVLREGLKKIAVYKDKDNKVHINSAICPHLGGCLRWNKGEKSWDCPLHGSRFDGCGKVITGPSMCHLHGESVN
ncbi:MAG TPA: FAD-dependent oxidoreductase [Parachlamydiaceae bacterium]|nr:FAD-dependent oxidoreductase [Parachlamydiaceae bacterium]